MHLTVQAPGMYKPSETIYETIHNYVHSKTSSQLGLNLVHKTKSNQAERN